MKISKLIVFLGYLGSSTLLIYRPINKSEENNISQHVWIIGVATILISYMVAFLTYLRNQCFSLLLEICQYLLLPFSAFLFVQYFQNFSKLHHSITLSGVFLILMEVLIMGLTVIKILYINQTFPGQSEKRILTFSLMPRILRVLKIALGCALCPLLDENALLIVVSVFNVVDLFLVSFDVTFMEVEIQLAQMLGSTNNLFSICSFLILGHEAKVYFLFISEIILCLVFIFVQNPLVSLLQFKYNLLFDKMQLNSHNFHLQEQKSILFLVFCCFDMMCQYQQVQRITIKQEVRVLFSFIFMEKLKTVYLTFLHFYFEFIESDTVFIRAETEITSSHSLNQSKRKQMNYNRENSQKKKIEFGKQFEKQIVLKYEKVYEKKINTSSQMIFDKVLFFDFMSFCINIYESKKTDHPFTWNYSHEFLLCFVLKFNENFIVKASKRFQFELAKQNDFFLNKVRNQKWKAYAKFSQNRNLMTYAPQQSFFRFLYFEQKIKQQIIQACKNQNKFAESLVNPFHNMMEIISELNSRWQDKNRILKLFQKAFKFPEYIYSQQFAYIFLLFSIIFCKSISKTSALIQEKFRMAHQQKCKLLLNTYDFNERSLAVCSGTQNNQFKFGDIFISNHTFKRKFGLLKENIHTSQQKISDFFNDQNQKLKHSQLMKQSANFSKNEITSKLRNKHSTYHCFLRCNLHQERYPIFKEFRISTTIFLGMQNIFSYVCEFTELSQNIFIQEKDFHFVQPKINEAQVSVNLNLKFSHEQLQKKMELIPINYEVAQLSGIDCVWNQLQEQYIETQQYGQEEEQTENDVKNSKIQDSIWTQGFFRITKFHKFAFLCFGSLMCTMIVAIVSEYFVAQNVMKSNTYIDQYDQLISYVYGTQTRYALNLYLMQKIESNKLSKNICSKYAPDFYGSLRNITESIAQQKINKYSKNSFYQDFKSVNYTTLMSALGRKTTVILSTSTSDYSNYMTGVIAKGERFLTYDLGNMNPLDRKQFVQHIQNHGKTDENTISKDFLKHISKQNIDFIKKAEKNYKRIFYTATPLLLLTLIIASFWFFCLFIEAYRFLTLLANIPEQKLVQRGYEAKFIISELQKLNEYYFKDCIFKTVSYVTITSITPQRAYVEELSLEEFQKITENENNYEEKENQSTEQMSNISMQKSEQKIPFNKNTGKVKEYFEMLIKVFNVNKSLFSFLILVDLAFLSLYMMVGIKFGNVFKNNLNMNTIIRQGGLTQQTLLKQQLAGWMMAFNDTQYYSVQKMKEHFDNSSDYLKQQKFFVLLYQTINTDILEETSYQTVCSLFHKANLMNETQCLSTFQSQYLQMRMPDFLGMISLSQLKILNSFSKGAMEEYQLQVLCKNYLTSVQIINPGISGSWTIMKNMINQNYLKSTQMMMAINRIIFVAFVIGVVCLLFLTVRMAVRIKFQVLTMDTPKDLYESPNFRPDLNRMYFRYK